MFLVTSYTRKSTDCFFSPHLRARLWHSRDISKFQPQNTSISGEMLCHLIITTCALAGLALLPRNSAHVNRSSPLNLTMCYMIERNTSGIIYDYNKAAAALDLAMDYANNYVLPSHLKLSSVYSDIGQTCSSRSHVIANALELRRAGIDCDVYIGPGATTNKNVSSVFVP